MCNQAVLRERLIFCFLPVRPSSCKKNFQLKKKNSEKIRNPKLEADAVPVPCGCRARTYPAISSFSLIPYLAFPLPIAAIGGSARRRAVGEAMPTGSTREGAESVGSTRDGASPPDSALTGLSQARRRTPQSPVGLELAAPTTATTTELIFLDTALFWFHAGW